MKKKEFSYKVEGIIGVLAESPTSDWGKFVIKARANDNPPTVDIRNMKIGSEEGEYTLGKGISLNDAQVDKLVDTLVKEGYGDASELEAEVNRRKAMYGFDDDDNYRDGPMVVKLA